MQQHRNRQHNHSQHHHRRRQMLAGAFFLIISGLMCVVWCSTWIDSLGLLTTYDWPAFCARR